MNTPFPLPLAPEARTSPVDYIPGTDDPHGRGRAMWEVMSRLKITQGPLAGKTLAKVAPAWQKAFIMALYGTTLPDGRRQFDEALLLISKKNGKSSFAAMLAIAHVLTQQEDRGVGILLADTKEQAHLVFDAMAATIRADPYLVGQFRVQDYRSAITHAPTGTTIRAIASELASTTGTAPSFYIVDELHLLGTRTRGADLVRQLSSGAAVRDEPLGIYITTAPIGPASGIYSSMISRARSILAGDRPEDRMLPALFELAPGMNPEDPTHWWRANPSLDRTFSMEWLRREYGIATADGDPTTLRHFLSQHLNVHAQEMLGVDRWIPLNDWDRYADKALTLDALLKRSSAVWLGIDAGGRDDHTALGVLGRTDDGALLFWGHQWLSRDGYDKRHTQAPLDQFIADRDLTVVDTPGGDLDALERTIDRIRNQRTVAGVGVDPYALKAVVQRLEAKGLTVLGVPQGWRMTPFVHETDRALYEGRLTHHGGSLMRWNIENARVEERGEAIAITKPSGASVGSKKIDGVMTLIMAMAALAESPPPKEYQLFFV